jgi:hypothetical protein
MGGFVGGPENVPLLRAALAITLGKPCTNKAKLFKLQTFWSDLNVSTYISFTSGGPCYARAQLAQQAGAREPGAGQAGAEDSSEHEARLGQPETARARDSRQSETAESPGPS